MHYEEVLAAVFRYLALLRRSFPLPAYHYDEAAAMARTRFRFAQKERPHAYVERLARDGSLPHPPEWILSGGYLYRGYDEAVVKGLLDSFTPENGRAFVLAKEHRKEVVGEDVQWETEQWYGTQYFVRRMGEDLLRRVCAFPARVG